jgi:DNA-binding NtrC family response regulator
MNPMVILLVDDDLGVQFSIWRLLKNDGFVVLTADGGKHALDASGKHPGPIDLLLCEMNLAQMDGLELCYEIVAKRPGIKVVLMSGDLAGQERARMKGLPFLRKPFTATALRNSIEAVLGPPPPYDNRRPSN